ncbi:MAG: sugar kinase [Dehalococcoidia bacterium]|nr:sugar kinase [Dehalococcoidia bacterium]MSQ35377.1 sugar kinase [Dehalococcoidia bacterium]
MNILVVGTVAYDAVETPEGHRAKQLGGSASYFATAASYFTETGIVSVVGRDFEKPDRDLLTSRGIDLSGVQVADGDTFRWSGQYKDDLNNAVTLQTQLNVLQSFSPKLGPKHTSAPYLFLANIDPRLQHAVLNSMSARPALVACDTMNLWINTARDGLLSLLPRVDAMLINEGEAKQLTAERQLPKAAATLLDTGLKTLIVKRGEYGAALFNRDFGFAMPAYPLTRVVDPTGAGDSFAGGFMGYMAAVGNTSEEATRRAVVAGSVMASFTVEAFGLDRLAFLTANEINLRFRAFENLMRFHPLGGGQGLPLMVG